jgi:hypothetical protein
MNRSVLNSPRLLELKKKQRKILRRKIFFWVFLFLLILVGLSFLSKWEKINISDIQISGNKMVETKLIESVVKEKIDGNYLWVFPKTNFLIYPKGEIEKELTNKFKRLENISLKAKNFKTLEISLSERTALYTWCGATLPETIDNNQKCYFLDKNGYIFDEAPYFSGEVYLKFFGSASLGSYFFQPNFARLISFKETTEKIGVKPVIFYIQDDGDIKMFLSSPSMSQLGPEIIFPANSDFEKVAENLQTVLTTEPLKSDFKSKYSSLLSIDLSFGNKVYYKFK